LDNFNYYLVNEFAKNKLNWWTLSLSINNEGFEDEIFVVNNIGSLSEENVGNSIFFRPAITLKSICEISSGFGTQDSPYIIE